MTNNLNNKRSSGVIIAAIISCLIVTVCGLVCGLVFAVRMRNRSDYVDESRRIAGYLLVDSAENLRSTISALRLCNEPEPAEAQSRAALVYAVRCETALECRSDDWADSRSKEAFLNDVTDVLNSPPELVMEMSDRLYALSTEFCDAVTYGEKFEYNGELEKRAQPEHAVSVTEEQILAARKLVASALDATSVEYAGNWNGHIEFMIMRGKKSGYAVVCGEKIKEFSFTRGEIGTETDIETAKHIAEKTAKLCGYNNLEIKSSENTGRSISVIMCKRYGDALAADDYATAVIFDGETIAFSAGDCEKEHLNIPTPKKTEKQARAATKNGGEGVLVVRKLDGKERICYEYRYELEDGTHYVYVCAESGKQIEIK